MTPPPALPDASDQDLVAWARQGHEGACYELVRRCRPQVYTLAYRTIGDHHVAEELVQDAFDKAFGALGSKRPDAAFSAWILKIANNLVVDHMRRERARRRREPVIVRLEPTPDVTSPRRRRDAAVRAALSNTATPAPRDARALVPALQEALERLDETYRRCVILRDLEGRSYEEIAKRLRLPVSTVGTRLHRGRNELRAALGPAYDALMAASTPA